MRSSQSSGRIAVFANYGTREHVECITVVIQEGDLDAGGRVLDCQRFWSRDYASLERLLHSAVTWVSAKGARKVFQVADVLPLDECKNECIRVLNRGLFEQRTDK